MSETWTIGELAERAADTLRARSGDASAAQAASREAGGAAQTVNGRVREVPGARLIRWYTTIGLVDPPLTRRGRIALYGRRHLLQLVAIKRLQADGLSIAEIQTRLAGATDAHLATVAQVPRPQEQEPEGLPGPSLLSASPEPARARPRFWASPPSAPPTSAPIPPELDGQAAGMVYGVRLAHGVTVLLDGAGRAPAPGDFPAIATAAAPLLAVLAERGLIPPGPSYAQPSTTGNGSPEDQRDPIHTGPSSARDSATDTNRDGGPGERADLIDRGPPAAQDNATNSKSDDGPKGLADPVDAQPPAAQDGARPDGGAKEPAGPMGAGPYTAPSSTEDAKDLAGPTHVSHPEGSTA
ncbi:hypothetical protein DP939_10635 [Spongiactinospora rosea]|uniref:HTH merR-type domain-containing protein n=1 Tax=Spongiactinospora rosea TaxID=2248750 RepID=A0A366M2J7_9ACTN|nr:MerR family transcriptional regulator [Spongiactinospora rosea]RBQ20257.1 hypothetical protein DP939_10635 [Spongiactinospora rosea]